MMRTIAAAAMIVCLLVVGGTAFYLYVVCPRVGPAPSIRIEADETAIQRGRYLANHVAVCVDCHSTRDWGYWSGPIIPGTEGGGGERFEESFGTVIAPNITPAALAGWTDGEILRAVTSGIRRDGEPLTPLMPYSLYSRMSEADARSVVAYVRTLDPIHSTPPRSTLDFPMNLIVRTLPEPAVLRESAPDQSNPAEYGEYLTTIGGCVFCHTPSEQGNPIEGMAFAGGFEFQMPWGTVRSANITPSTEAGIGGWSEQDFIDRFKTFESASMQSIPADTTNTVMPWTMYAGMTTQDLSAIYSFLRTVPANHNKVTTHAVPQQ